MDKEQAFKIELPKWPQCVITGDKVTKEQAMDIIRKTDEFFFGYSGNNSKFNAEVRRIVGMYPEYDYSKTYTDEERKERAEAVEAFAENLVFLNYLFNDWISCCWVGGPHGWCSPEGEIGYQNNIGKWPTVEDVYEDLTEIGKAFPYVCLTCTLVNSEEGYYDKNTKTLVTMKLKDGEVTFHDPIPLNELKYGGVKCSFDLGHENYFSLDEIKKWWGK